ncbi:hypothetical protein YC2023_028577 [Brassica napus]
MVSRPNELRTLGKTSCQQKNQFTLTAASSFELRFFDILFSFLVSSMVVIVLSFVFGGNASGSVEVDEQWIYYIVNIKKIYYRLKSQAWTRLDSGPVHTSQSLLIVKFVKIGTFFGTRSKLAVRTCTFTRVSYLYYAYHVRADNNRE